MKKVKIALATLLVTAGLIGAFAFKSQKATLVQEEFKFTSLDREIGVDIVTADLNNSAKWSLDLPSVSPDINGDFLRGIIIESYESVNDEGSTPNDGAISKQEALDAVRAYYSSHMNSLPDNNTAIVKYGVNVFVYRSDDNN